MIIDSHIHLQNAEWAGHRCWFASAGEAIDYLRRAGIGRAVFNSWRAVLGATLEDLDAGNAETLELYRQDPDFLVPGAVVYPPFFEASRDWMARFRDIGSRWVGELVPYQQERYDSAEYLRLFEACAREGHLVQLHATAEVAAVARRFPEMTVVNSHLPPDPPALAMEPNVVMDISGMACGLAVGGLERALAAFGPGRLLFGSDFTGYEPRGFIGRVRQLVASEVDREAIFHGNAARLIGEYFRP